MCASCVAITLWRCVAIAIVLFVVQQSLFGVASQSPQSPYGFLCSFLSLCRNQSLALCRNRHFRCLFFSRCVAITLWRCVTVVFRFLFSSRCVAINMWRCVAIAIFRCLFFSRCVAITIWRCVATAARAQMVLPIGRGISARRGRGSFFIAAQRARSYAAARANGARSERLPCPLCARLGACVRVRVVTSL